MKDGFVQVPRAFFLTDEWNEKRRYSKAEAMVDLMKEATFKQRTVECCGYQITLEPGELVASKRFFSKRWGWPATTVGTFLRKLATSGFATIGPPHLTRRPDRPVGPPPNVVRLSFHEGSIGSQNYSRTALLDYPEGPPDRTKTEQGIKKKKDYTPSFLKFWEAYPRKVAKATAFKAWKSNGCEAIAEVVVNSVHEHVRNAWSDPQFIPHPTTFLNGHRWEDEIRKAAAKTPMTEKEHREYLLKGVNQ